MRAPSPALFSSIPQALSHWARQQPDATACTFTGRGLTVSSEITYQELEYSARQVATFLRSRARPGDRAVLLFPPGAGYLTAFLGCLFAGVVAVPLYPPRPGAKIERIAAVMRSCEATHAITTSAMALMLADLPATIGVATHTIETMLAGGEPQPIPESDPGGMAFLQYTSGSTGHPKGVMVSHRNLVDNELAIAAGFGIQPDDVILSWLPMYHDMGLIGTTLLPLFLGQKSVLLNTFEFIHDPLSWLLAIARFGGSCSGGPNFAYQLLIDRYDPVRLDGVDLSSWRIAFNGAEPVHQQTMDAFVSCYAPHGFAPSAFYPCYGLAEATLFVTGTQPGSGYRAEMFDRRAAEQGSLAPVQDETAHDEVLTIVSSGTACSDTTVVIRDNAGHGLPEGSVGEICVQGPGVAQGYWAAPVATAETFHTRIDGHDGVFLSTGDLGALVDGRLYVVGRQKDLIIVAGRNFAPHDVEYAGSAADDALRKGAAAAFQPDEGQEVVLVLEVQRASVAGLKSDPTAARALSAAVRRSVSVECGLDVSEVVFVLPGSIPRTSSGKIQRTEIAGRFRAGKLKIVRPARPEAASPAPTGLDPLRALLYQAATRHLGLQPTAADFRQPLAALGFDSLKLVALKATVERKLGQTVPADLFFGDRSLDEVIDAVNAAPSLDGPSDTPIAGTDRERDMPASAGQVELLFYDELNRGDTANNLVCALRFSRGLDEQQVRAAVAGAVSRHPALRTTLGPLGSGTQVVHDDVRPDWEFREFDSDDESPIRRFFTKVGYRPFDLVGGPLVRAAVAATPTATVFILVCHHAIVDYWSLRIVLAEVVAELLDARELVPADEPGTASAVEWARLQARSTANEKLAALAERWQPRRDQVLFALQRNGKRRNAAATIDFEVPAGPTRQLFERSKASGFTPFVGIAAAYLHALHRVTGNPEVIIGTPHHGRSDWRFGRTVGHLVNMMPLLGDFRTGADIATLEERTWRELRTALATAEIPFSQLVTELQPDRHGQNPLFQATLTFQQSADGVLPDGFAIPWTRCRHTVRTVEIEAFDVPPRDVAFALSLYGAKHGDRLVFRLLYQRDLIDSELAQRVCRQFQESLSELTAVAPISVPRKS